MRFCLFALAFILFLSCKEEQKREVQLVKFVSSPTGPMSSLPSLSSNKDITLISWVEKVNDSLTKLKYARLIGGQWKDPKLITQGEDWFVNWADFPTIAENNGNLVSHVLKKSSKKTFSYDVRLNVMGKENSQWAADLQLHSDSTKTEHGFVTTLPYDEAFFITWLDGRNTSGSGHDHHGGAMTIRAAEVSSKGLISNEHVLDERTCDCCQTTAAITANGPVVVYRDRSDDEVRDMSIVRLVNGNWTAPKTINNDNWQIKGCPVNGPKADAIDNDLVVAWFTEANGEAKVKVTFSSDGGVNFDKPIRIGDTKAMGRVDIALIDAERAIVSWMETINQKALFKAVKVNKNGQMGRSIVIDTMAASRKSGFPQMELVQDKIYFAWTDATGDITTVKTANVRLDSF
ncbi:hypothetical protein [Maribacter sp. HTCC2170]|uniref:hypothetical protein n=1 Tax=Maribacter sp. (strain HTCC2170 / KCCM 42371) TaxID=313603 RepID=UPI00006BD542|nr:hypothetical protein [Maribacter sp. HTCC2170]EAR02032.1 BNR repeat protein putative [Maribacter sp. HTCC2170]